MVSIELASWLGWEYRSPNSYTKFVIVEVRENGRISSRVKSSLAGLLSSARVDPRLIRIAVDRFGWQRVKTLLTNIQPMSATGKRGEFGEVLVAAILVAFLGYIVPVQKLRFAIMGEQSLPSTDIIAVKKGSKGLTEVSFVESKLRTTGDTGAAVQAYEQLKQDYSEKVPDMVMFVVSRLYERGDPLFNDFLDYMFDRNDTAGKESFNIGLVWEQDNWTETVLQNLEDDIEDSNQLRIIVEIVRINDLRGLVDEAFQLIGVTKVLDDE